MIRLLEFVVAIVIVVILAVLFGVALPNHGHIERTLEISNPARQVYDSIDGFSTYPSWSALSSYDTAVKFTPSGPVSGKGAKIDWASTSPQIGNGNLTIDSDQQDTQVKMLLENDWKGLNKAYTINLAPTQNGKTVKITWAYDADYGWDLLARYSGLYLEGDPAAQIQLNLGKLSNTLATVPLVDYKDTVIEIADVVAKPVLMVSTSAKRSLDEVADATDKATGLINDVIKKNKLVANGPRTTVTTNWGDDTYSFDVLVPVDRNDINLPEENPVKVANSFAGKALKNTFTGSPAQLPLVRLMLKAYALTHGYKFDDTTETGTGRFFDELTTSDPAAADDQQSFNVYLPIQTQ